MSGAARSSRSSNQSGRPRFDRHNIGASSGSRRSPSSTRIVVVTTPDVPGAEIKEALGLVRGSCVQSRGSVHHDIGAAFRSTVGGEMRAYSELMERTSDEALQRMIAAAARLRADAVVQVRFQSSEVTQHAAEILAYGTAVRLAE